MSVKRIGRITAVKVLVLLAATLVGAPAFSQTAVPPTAVPEDASQDASQSEATQAAAATTMPAASTAAEDGQLSIEELEAYIAQQKKELDMVIENRELARQQKAEIQEKLQAEQERQQEVEQQLLELCEQHNTANPDNPLDCEKEVDAGS